MKNHLKITNKTVVLTWLGLALAALTIHGCDRNKNPYQKYEQSPFVVLTGNQDQVLRFDMERLRSLTIFDDLRKGIDDFADSDGWLKSFEATIGSDPFSVVDRLVIGLHGDLKLSDPLANAIIVARGDFSDPQKLMADFARFNQDHSLFSTPLFNPTPAQGSQHGSFAISKIESSLYRNPDEKVQFFFAFPTSRLMIFSRQELYVKDSLDVMSGIQPGIQSHEKWKDVLSLIDLGATVSGYGAFPRSLQQAITQKTRDERQLSGLENLSIMTVFNLSLKIDSSEYLLNLDLQCDSIEDAQALKDDLIEAHPYLSGRIEDWYRPDSSRANVMNSFLERLQVVPQSDSARVILRASRQDVERLARELIYPPK